MIQSWSAKVLPWPSARFYLVVITNWQCQFCVTICSNVAAWLKIEQSEWSTNPHQPMNLINCLNQCNGSSSWSVSELLIKLSFLQSKVLGSLGVISGTMCVLVILCFDQPFLSTQHLFDQIHNKWSSRYFGLGVISCQTGTLCFGLWQTGLSDKLVRF